MECREMAEKGCDDDGGSVRTHCKGSDIPDKAGWYPPIALQEAPLVWPDPHVRQPRSSFSNSCSGRTFRFWHGDRGCFSPVKCNLNCSATNSFHPCNLHFYGIVFGMFSLLFDTYTRCFKKIFTKTRKMLQKPPFCFFLWN